MVDTCHQESLPSGKHTKSYGNGPFIVTFPIKNGDFPVRYVSLPEGNILINIHRPSSFIQRHPTINGGYCHSISWWWIDGCCQSSSYFPIDDPGSIWPWFDVRRVPFSQWKPDHLAASWLTKLTLEQDSDISWKSSFKYLKLFSSFAWHHSCFFIWFLMIHRSKMLR